MRTTVSAIRLLSCVADFLVTQYGQAMVDAIGRSVGWLTARLGDDCGGR